MASPEHPGARSRRPLFRHPARVAIVAVGLLVVLNLGVALLVMTETNPEAGGRRLPTFVESVLPEPGSVVRLQETVSVDLETGRTGVLVVNGLEIPEDQLDRNEPLGVVSFRPGPDKDFERWTPGDVAVEIRSWPATDERPPDPDSWSWTFRAG